MNLTTRLWREATAPKKEHDCSQAAALCLFMHFAIPLVGRYRLRTCVSSRPSAPTLTIAPSTVMQKEQTPRPDVFGEDMFHFMRGIKERLGARFESVIRCSPFRAISIPFPGGSHSGIACGNVPRSVRDTTRSIHGGARPRTIQRQSTQCPVLR